MGLVSAPLKVAKCEEDQGMLRRVLTGMQKNGGGECGNDATFGLVAELGFDPFTSQLKM